MLELWRSRVDKRATRSAESPEAPFALHHFCLCLCFSLFFFWKKGTHFPLSRVLPLTSDSQFKAKLWGRRRRRSQVNAQEKTRIARDIGKMCALFPEHHTKAQPTTTTSTSTSAKFPIWISFIRSLSPPKLEPTTLRGFSLSLSLYLQVLKCVQEQQQQQQQQQLHTFWQQKFPFRFLYASIHPEAEHWILGSLFCILDPECRMQNTDPTSEQRATTAWMANKDRETETYSNWLTRSRKRLLSKRLAQF